uniref:Uncharacterized protein n=1 Tax=Cacopsylla melanoneura TaxID=428564 RepID=A0A8D8RES7_9HEMI
MKWCNFSFTMLHQLSISSNKDLCSCQLSNRWIAGSSRRFEPEGRRCPEGYHIVQCNCCCIVQISLELDKSIFQKLEDICFEICRYLLNFLVDFTTTPNYSEIIHQTIKYYFEFWF